VKREAYSVELAEDEWAMLLRLVRFSGLNPWTPSELDTLVRIVAKLSALPFEGKA